MSKNVVVCCDGTANEFAADRTNVVKLYFSLVQDPSSQTTYYHPGLGTMEAPGAYLPITKAISRRLGQAFGTGLENDIRDAYVFIMNNFTKGDRLFLFGFSRGAYTVRAIASLLKMYGLLPRGNDALVPYAIRMMHGIHDNDDGPNASFRLAGEFRTTFDNATSCRPYFVGVWDTVSSVGWVENPLRIPYSADNPDIEHGRHAIALDERRAFFRTNLWWPSNPEQDIKQVWFAGVHCDVGGGFPESESGLSKLALKWMMDEAAGLGLLFNEPRKQTVLGIGPDTSCIKPNAAADAHESLTAKWWPAEVVFKKSYDRSTKTTSRRFNLGRRRTVPPGSLIHASVLKRGSEYCKRLPDGYRVEPDH